MTEQKTFSSNIGAIMAAVGSAVGLGNIWRFPYICGQYGGGAFLLVYIAFVFLLGMVIMISEFIIGRRTRHAPVQAYASLCPKGRGWRYIGLLGVLTCFFILSQYFVLSGWTTGYCYHSVAGHLGTLGNDSSAIAAFYTTFSTAAAEPSLFLIVFGVITGVVIFGGVQKGIEAVSKILLPILVLLLLAMCVRSLSLPGAMKGVSYLFQPDFSKLTGEGVLAALGQALFSLSVGMGAMIVYGSYIPQKDNLMKTAVWITVCDTLIALLSGLAIFPAVFSFGFDPAGGAGLVYNVLPNVFNSMQGGQIFSSMFFLLLALAALTSAISLLETITAWACEEFGLGRSLSTGIVTLLTVGLGVVLSLSLGVWSEVKVFGLSLFNLVDRMNSIYLPPLSALGTMVFLMWVAKEDDLKDELTNGNTLEARYYPLFRFLARYVVPLALLVVLVTGIAS